MAEWIHSGGAACYNSSTPGYAISQTGILTVGALVVVNFTISNMTGGKLVIDSLAEKPEFTEDGEYQAIGIATSANLIFIGDSVYGNTFDGCISAIESRLAPLLTIKDLADNIVFTQVDNTGMSGSVNNIQYQIDWTDIAEGCYKLCFTDGVIEYESDPFRVKTAHECSIQLNWSNNENAYGFDYTGLTFSPSLRITGKKWMPKYSKDKEVFKDSIGNRTILRSDTSKVEILIVDEVPEYVHDALSIGIEHDTFEIDAIEYVVEETEYSPKWRKSSSLAPVEIDVMRRNQNLVNENCA